MTNFEPTPAPIKRKLSYISGDHNMQSSTTILSNINKVFPQKA
jgi:hypothetical protein